MMIAPNIAIQFGRRVLCGFSQCAFQANEITGVLFIAAVAVFNWRMAIFYVISGVIATLVATALKGGGELLQLGPLSIQFRANGPGTRQLLSAKRDLMALCVGSCCGDGSCDGRLVEIDTAPVLGGTLHPRPVGDVAFRSLPGLGEGRVRRLF